MHTSQKYNLKQHTLVHLKNFNGKGGFWLWMLSIWSEIRMEKRMYKTQQYNMEYIFYSIKDKNKKLGMQEKQNNIE